MEAPERIDPKGPADYFEVLTKAVFQSGISWRVVAAKWDGFRIALEGFEPEKVAAFDDADVDRLVADKEIIRNRRKIEATIENARTMIDLEDEHRDFRSYLRSHGGFEETAADLRKRFKFLGDLGAFYFLWVVGEETPTYDEWRASRGVEPVA